MGKQWRHGDVVIEEVTEIPKNVTKSEDNTLAYGEVTGHGHRMGNTAMVYIPQNDPDPTVRFFEVKREQFGLLRHEEHTELKFPPGKYRSFVKRQWNTDSEEKVVD